MHAHVQLVAIASLVWLAKANNPVADSVFSGGFQPLAAAQAGAPMFHFADGSCFPQAAIWNGQQSQGRPLDACLLDKLSEDCPAQPPYTGDNTHAHDFPTYYVVRKCDDNTWRVAYDLYFVKDSGHSNDWEWTVVVYKQYGDSWYRDSVIMEQDGSHRHTNWGDLESTFDGQGDMFNDNQKYLDHPKIYVNKYHHAHHSDLNHNNKDNCAVTTNQEFRYKDYYYYAADWLVDGTTVPGNLNWGKADSTPASFWQGGKYDVCKL